ncbi:HAD family phosphatase [Gammaproteobacteria bacterium]|nr:HAD family phosphatase [Gammaproteobacteria bacterium]
MTKIEAVLFDMDGVLIEAKDWHYEALNKALKLFGMDISRHEHETTFDGLPTRKKLEMLTNEKGLPSQLHEFINHMKQKYTMDIVQMNCKPTFNHEYALSKLKYDGFKMAVCSNSIRNTIEVMMKNASLDSYFDFYISNEDVVMSKPDPEMYTKAINKMNLKPLQCMIIEDNENGIKAARASGANVMIVEKINDVNYLNIKKNIIKFEGNTND